MRKHSGCNSPFLRNQSQRSPIRYRNRHVTYQTDRGRVLKDAWVLSGSPYVFNYTPQTDGVVNVTTHQYDGLDRPVLTTFPEGNSVATAYDGATNPWANNVRSGPANLNSAISGNSGHDAGLKAWRKGVFDGEEESIASARVLAKSDQFERVGRGLYKAKQALWLPSALAPADCGRSGHENRHCAAPPRLPWTAALWHPILHSRSAPGEGHVIKRRRT